MRRNGSIATGWAALLILLLALFWQSRGNREDEISQGERV